MIKHDRDFKGVWIPKEVWLSEKLSLMEKALFVEIHSLDNERGCFASNKYFAEFFGVSDRQISTYVSSLREKGFISVTIHDSNQRTIRAIGKFRRIRDSEIRQFEESKAEVIHSMSVGFEGGTKKTSWGARSNVPR